MDYRIRKGDKCLEVGTDSDRTSGVAFTAVGRCSNESPRSGYHRYVEGQSHVTGSQVAETGLVKCESISWEGTTEHCKDEIPLCVHLSEACDRYR